MSGYAAAEFSHDAVVIVPGIMGSELYDRQSGRQIWGLRDSRWYTNAWFQRNGLRRLHLTPDEHEGLAGRVVATRLLRFPAFCPVLAGFEPYTRLVEGVRRVVHSEAILEFPYDWRLPVPVNAGLLADAIDQHIARWRASETQQRLRRRHPDGRPAQVVVVAHSMGGLLARALSLIPGAADNIRACVTLGTPFLGAVKAAVIVNSGRGAPVPLPRQRLRELASVLPGLHDLMPTYRCVDTGDGARHLTPADVAALGGDLELATASQAFHRRLADASMTGHRALVGVEQPTAQSLRIADGVAYEQMYSFQATRTGELVPDKVTGMLKRVNRGGDGTVYRDAASIAEAACQWLPQQHGALAASDEAVSFVRAIITEHDRDLGPALGFSAAGLILPDVVNPDADWPLTVTGIDSPAAATCTVLDIASNRQVSRPQLHLRDGTVRAVVNLPGPGLYRVVVESGSSSPVTQLVLAGASDTVNGGVNLADGW